MRQKTARKRAMLFIAIGVFNTALDIGLYVLLLHLGLDIVKANTISTSAALIVSYNLNRRFTFDDRFSDKKTIWKFLVVTLSGLWILQPVLIYTVIAVFSNQWVIMNFGLLVAYAAFIGKLAATAASLAWNFVLYNQYVFRQTETENKK